MNIHHQKNYSEYLRILQYFNLVIESKPNLAEPYYYRAVAKIQLEDFLGAIVNIYGPRMLRYKGVLYMQGSERKVIFQGVHQLMGSDLGPVWAENEAKVSKMVFIGIDLPKDILLQGLEQCLV